MFGGDLPVKRQSRKWKRKTNRATVQTTFLWAQSKENLLMGMHTKGTEANLLAAEEKTVHFQI
ncbi:hypothetical protein [Paenibacillus sabinae]|uniref:Uncharacterized protein n=1 Tax=Paenibacillus sabinae T27 TaxID=1268072 RepID=X5A4F7_9BACL|nr:hypothetical protein [Paenibacillus sabinae]AHV99168.1 hypothetical protein PSAB_21395 [Paenibacillus sabinae T27]